MDQIIELYSLFQPIVFVLWPVISCHREPKSCAFQYPPCDLLSEKLCLVLIDDKTKHVLILFELCYENTLKILQYKDYTANSLVSDGVSLRGHHPDLIPSDRQKALREDFTVLKLCNYIIT